MVLISKLLKTFPMPTISSQCIWGAPKSLQMVTAAMKLKDAYSFKIKKLIKD